MARKKKPVGEEAEKIVEAASAEETPSSADVAPVEESVADVDVAPVEAVPEVPAEEVAPEAIAAEEPAAEYAVESLPDEVPAAEEVEAVPVEEAMQEVETLPEALPAEVPAEEAAVPVEAQMDVDEIDLDVVEEVAPAAVEAPQEAAEDEVLDFDVAPEVPAEEPPAPEPVAEESPVVVAAVAAPIVEAAPAEEASAPAVEEKGMDIDKTPVGEMPAPDYNTRHMRRERNGFAGHFRLAEGEQVLSMYRALKGKGVGGRIYLTNRRFLMESALRTEMPIEAVAGVSTGRSRRVKVLKLIFSLLFMAGGAALFVVFFLPNLLGNWPVFEDMAWLRYVFYGVGGLLAFIGFLMFCTSFSSRFVFTILTVGVQQTISVRSSVSRKDMDVYQPLTFGKKGKDYKKFCANFGARLAEIRKALGK